VANFYEAGRAPVACPHANRRGDGVALDGVHEGFDDAGNGDKAVAGYVLQHGFLLLRRHARHHGRCDEPRIDQDRAYPEAQIALVFQNPEGPEQRVLCYAVTELAYNTRFGGNGSEENNDPVLPNPLEAM
jgi:hypothetical protein